MHCRDAPLHDATCQTCSTDSVANSGCRRPLLGRRGQPLPQPSRATQVCQRRLQLRAVFTYGESNDIRLRHIILLCTYNNGDPPYWHLAPVHCQVALKLRRRDFRGGLTQGPSLTQPLLPRGLANYATPLAPFYSTLIPLSWPLPRRHPCHTDSGSPNNSNDSNSDSSDSNGPNAATDLTATTTRQLQHLYDQTPTGADFSRKRLPTQSPTESPTMESLKQSRTYSPT